MKNSSPETHSKHVPGHRGRREMIIGGWLAGGLLAFSNLAPVATSAPLEQSNHLELGVADYGQYGPKPVEHLIHSAENLDLDMVRLTMEWSPGQTRLDPSQEEVVNMANKNDDSIDILYTLSFDRGRDAPVTGRQRHDFIAWAKDLVKNGAKLVEATNEPMEPLFWSTDNPAQEYAELLAGLYPALHRENPDVTVIAGSLARHDADSFMARLTTAIHGRKVADAVSLHYPTSAADYEHRVGLLRQCFGDLPVYVSEDGSNLKNETAQAAFDRRKITIAKRQGAAAWILLQIQNKRDLPWHTGVYLNNGAKAPTYRVLQQAANQEG